nr:PREDICTED: facilitated trehalose transporter Tret1-like [Bemisia tabaci]
MVQLAWLSRNRGRVRQISVCCSASILPFGHGLLVAWPSLAIERLRRGDAGFEVSSGEISIIVSMMSLGMCLMPIPFGYVLVRLGRKTNLLINAVVYAVAWGLIAFAPSPLWIMVGNFFAGLGSSIQLIIGPLYIAEVADKDIRGALISIYIMAIAIGQVFMTSIGIFVSYFELNLMSLIIAIVAFFCILTTAVESTSWYLMVDNEYEAERSFHYYWNTGAGTDRTQSLATLKETVALEMKSACSYVELFRTPSNIRASIIVIAQSVFQSAGGIVAILTYGSTTLPAYDGFWKPNPTMALVSVLNLVFNIVSAGFVDRIGRKPLTIISNAGNALGTAMVAAYFAVERRTNWNVTDLEWLPYVGFLTYVAFYGSGMFTVPHILVGELFPVNVRYHAAVLSTISIAGSCAFFNYIYLGVSQVAGVDVMFLIFTLCSISATVFSWIFMFETKNLSLADIQAKMTRNSTRASDPTPELENRR